MASYSTLIDSYGSPTELTQFTRQILLYLNVDPDFFFLPYMPNVTLPDDTYSFQQGYLDLIEHAQYRAFDTEAPFAGRFATKATFTGKIPPVSLQMRLSEYDRMKLMHTGADALLNSTYDDLTRLVRAMAVKQEIQRAEAIITGALSINENGFIADVDFGRDASCVTSAAIPWDDPAADILGDLEAQRQAAVNLTGVEPNQMIISRRIMYAMRKNVELRNQLFAGSLTTPPYIQQAQITQVIQNNGLPEIVVYDKRFNIRDLGTIRTTPDNVVIMLPDPGAAPAPGGALGMTAWGVTAAASEPEYGLVGGGMEAAGIVAAQFHTIHPVGIYTVVDALALPILANPNLTRVMTVMATNSNINQVF